MTTINRELISASIIIYVNDLHRDYFVGTVENKLPVWGTLYYKNNSSYTGPFKSNKRSGNGTFLSRDGIKYNGQFLDDKMSGYGLQTLPKGDTYEGNFLNGFRDGSGVFTWANGAKYIGNFVNNSRCVNRGYSYCMKVLVRHEGIVFDSRSRLDQYFRLT